MLIFMQHHKAIAATEKVREVDIADSAANHVQRQPALRLQQVERWGEEKSVWILR